MAELSAWSTYVYDHPVTFEGVPYDGKLEIVYLEDRKTTKLRRADPRVVVTAEWLRRVPGQLVAFDGDLLKVHTNDGSAVYRVDHRDVPRFLYLLSWPD